MDLMVTTGWWKNKSHTHSMEQETLPVNRETHCFDFHGLIFLDKFVNSINETGPMGIMRNQMADAEQNTENPVISDFLLSILFVKGRCLGKLRIIKPPIVRTEVTHISNALNLSRYV